MLGFPPYSPCARIAVHHLFTLGMSMSTAYLVYIDPGSGSLLLQALAGGVAAVGVFAKVYWRRMKTFLRIRKPEEEGPQT
jgi:hypothetical protein